MFILLLHYLVLRYFSEALISTFRGSDLAVDFFLRSHPFPKLEVKSIGLFCFGLFRRVVQRIVIYVIIRWPGLFRSKRVCFPSAFGKPWFAAVQERSEGDAVDKCVLPLVRIRLLPLLTSTFPCGRRGWRISQISVVNMTVIDAKPRT